MNIIEILIHFGLTKESITPLVVVGGCGLFFIWQAWLKKLLHNTDVLTNAMAEIQTFLKDKFDFIPVHPVKTKGIAQAYSPVRLTEFGNKLLKESGAEKVIDDQYEKLEKTIDDEHCKTALDIQWFIQKLIPKLKNKDFMNSVKSFVYHHPNYDDIELELEDVERAMVLYLRDKYLEKHPEITQ